MQLNLHNAGDHLAVRSYSEQSVVLGNETYTQSVIFTPDGTVETLAPTHVDDLSADVVAQALKADTEVVILGTGPRQIFPSTDFRRSFLQRNVGLEVMANDAACRTYNVLASEGRAVVGVVLFSP